MKLRRRSTTFIATLLLSMPALGQPAPPGSAPALPKLAPPSVFPPPGTYPTTESITLVPPEPDTKIHFTWDGSTPTASSPLYDPQSLLFVFGIYDGDRGIKSGYTLRAIATKQDRKDSDVVTAQYVIDRRNRDSYVSEEIVPGVRMIRDSDNDKMFLITGTKACVLIDSGMGKGNLREYVSQFTHQLPIKVVFTHNHGDHIGQANQFIETSVEYIEAADRAGAVTLLQRQGVPDSVTTEHLKEVADGERIDLGDRELVVYATPGHTPGSVIVFDEKNGWLFTGDSFGSNSPTIPDVLWMQRSSASLDNYMATIKLARAKLRRPVRLIMTGHNDRPLVGDAFLNNLETALQQLMDKGEAALIPSYRPAGLKQVVVGDRFSDPNWAGININTATYLPAPVDEISTLVHIGLDGAILQEIFKPEVRNYTATAAPDARAITVTAIPASSRAKRITVNGKRLSANSRNRVSLKQRTTPVTIEVLAPDAKTIGRYVVIVTSK